jgi:hypothetical protein
MGVTGVIPRLRVEQCVLALVEHAKWLARYTAIGKLLEV